jgi:hypothetical protein
MAQVAKLFTVFFIIIGIGIAGVAAGTLADWIRRAPPVVVATVMRWSDEVLTAAGTLRETGSA